MPHRNDTRNIVAAKLNTVVLLVHIMVYTYSKVKVKMSRNRPDVAQRVPGGLGSQIS